MRPLRGAARAATEECSQSQALPGGWAPPASPSLGAERVAAGPGISESPANFKGARLPAALISGGAGRALPSKARVRFQVRFQVRAGTGPTSGSHMLFFGVRDSAAHTSAESQGGEGCRHRARQMLGTQSRGSRAPGPAPARPSRCSGSLGAVGASTGTAAPVGSRCAVMQHTGTFRARWPPRGLPAGFWAPGTRRPLEALGRNGTRTSQRLPDGSPSVPGPRRGGEERGFLRRAEGGLSPREGGQWPRQVVTSGRREETEALRKEAPRAAWVPRAGGQGPGQGVDVAARL